MYADVHQKFFYRKVYSFAPGPDPEGGTREMNGPCPGSAAERLRRWDPGTRSCWNLGYS
jgi:hypothetical protein